MHATQVQEFQEDAYGKVKDTLQQVSEDERKKRAQEKVEERLKEHLETTANKVFETAKDRYKNMKVERDNKKKQKLIL